MWADLSVVVHHESTVACRARPLPEIRGRAHEVAGPRGHRPVLSGKEEQQLPYSATPRPQRGPGRSALRSLIGHPASGDQVLVGGCCCWPIAVVIGAGRCQLAAVPCDKCYRGVAEHFCCSLNYDPANPRPHGCSTPPPAFLSEIHLSTVHELVVREPKHSGIVFE